MDNKTVTTVINWYKENGVDEVIGNTPHNFLAQEIISTEMSDIDLARALADKSNSLAELKENLLSFDRCMLKKTATNTVFGEGNPQAKVMFIGEAPGANEDLQGLPFCGQSGKLLTKILASIGLSRETNSYISNSVFWRPPGNRRPSMEEILMCRPFTEKHIALVAPKLLVCVGSVAAASLFNNTSSMSQTRGKFIKYQNKYLKEPIDCFTIFHPAYLLRQPSQKKTMWFDFLTIKNYLNNV